MTRVIPTRSWGAFTASAGKIKPAKRKTKSASEAIRQRKSKKQTVVSPAKARGAWRP
jgi:hypothetical protein